MLTKWRGNGIDRTSRTGAKYGHMGNERSALVCDLIDIIHFSDQGRKR
jgi:hypothetical protein